MHEHAPGCQRQSDPGWRLEALCTSQAVHPDEDARLRRVTAALTAAGPASGARGPLDVGTPPFSWQD